MKIFSDSDIQKNIALESEREKVEEYMYVQYRHFVRASEVRAILPQEIDRLTAYHDAFLATTAAIANGLYRGESSIKNFFWKIFYFQCVTLSRSNATIKAGITRPGKVSAEELLAEQPIHALFNHTTLLDREEIQPFFKDFRQKYYKCYFLLVLYDASGLSAEEVLQIIEHQTITRAEGTTQQLDDLIDMDEDAPQKITFPNVEALRMAASRCREKLRVFASKKLNLPHRNGK